MKNNLLGLLLFISAIAFGQSVPNTHTFSLRDVTSITNGTSLGQAFTNSVDAYFDATYKGNKDRLSNFRNYTEVEQILVYSISISGASSGTVGSTIQLAATVLPSNASNAGVSWSSSNTSIATVNSSGLVTLIGAGNVTITATAADGSGVSDSKALTVTAQTPQLGNFIGLGFFHYFWRGLHQLADGRVLVTTYQDGTGIYKVENDALSWFQNDNRNYWTDICQLNNSDVLATSYGKIYKKINDLGDFAEFISLSHDWSTICAASTGGAIACVHGGDIYLISGSGSYVALGETSRNWSGICQLNNGDVAACVAGGDIYYSIGGTGIYGGIGGTPRNWSGICQLNNGDILACVFGGDIYRSVDGGPFLPLGQTSRNWSGICALANGGAMATVSNGDIYKAIIE